ncbi:TetR family transcriptional regulator [Bradyrhizobium centrolobii]|uniref:TetR family transcriptional regulator n=2 Tax=Bradyrhizobium centrolobii TaxID=1505087 RepID=A0A176Y9B4_9BRAD|nr:TetR/AcrR family transcriptional regulator [Bradyrhizobium centrolobii]OAF01152.1 TetR family transcriptional regulator [Bradyrhizobium centrolobii]
MANGRPREFDVELALDRAMELFWRKGYEGTSLSDLTETLGITRPSLYAAFGNKEVLFRTVLKRYEANVVTYRRKALNAHSAYAVARELLEGAANLFGDESKPAGCLGVQGALACGEDAEPVRQELVANRSAGERALRQRLKRAKTEGDLPADSNPASLARFLSAVVYGMAVLSAGGASHKELLQVTELALRIWSQES